MKYSCLILNALTAVVLLGTSPCLAMKRARQDNLNRPAKKQCLIRLNPLSTIPKILEHEDIKIETSSDELSNRIWDIAPLWDRAARDFLLISDHEDELVFGEFSPNGKTILTRSFGIMCVWDAATGAPLVKIHDKKHSFTLSLIPENKAYIAGHVADNNAHIRDFLTGEKLGELKGEIGPVNLIAVSPNGKMVATVELDTISLWDLESRTQLASLVHHDISLIQFTPDSKVLVTGSYKGTVKLWDIESRKIIKKLTANPQISTVECHPDGSTILTTSGNIASLWDAHKGTPIRDFKEHRMRLYKAIFALEGKRVITIAVNGIVQLWNTETAELLLTLPHDERVYGAALSPNESLIVTAAADQALIWDTKTGTLLTSLDHKMNALLAVAFSPCGNSLLSVSNENKAYNWDLSLLSRFLTLKITNSQFSIDGISHNFIQSIK